MPPDRETITDGRPRAAVERDRRGRARGRCRAPPRPGPSGRRCPPGPVWGVTSVMPRIVFASAHASSGSFASFTPPPLPRPPAWICALTTARPPSRLRDLPRLRRVVGDLAARHGHAVAREDRLGLVLVDFHGTRRIIRGGRPSATARSAEQFLRVRDAVVGPVHLGDRGRQRNLLRADPHAVLGVAAVVDAARPHQRLEPLVRVHRARRVEVEEPRLRDRRRRR